MNVEIRRAGAQTRNERIVGEGSAGLRLTDEVSKGEGAIDFVDDRTAEGKNNNSKKKSPTPHERERRTPFFAT
jgi:hypothetical protein